MPDYPKASPRLIVCNGLDLAGGERCGKTTGTRTDQARAAGWRIGQLPDGTPDAMCPTCARPAPDLVRLCRDLDRSTKP